MTHRAYDILGVATWDKVTRDNVIGAYRVYPDRIWLVRQGDTCSVTLSALKSR